MKKIFQGADNNILVLIVLGILLRIILMVSSCHFDLLSYYWLSHRAVYHGDASTETIAIPKTAEALNRLHASWLVLIKKIINNGRDPWTEDWFLKEDPHRANIDSWRQFVNQPNIHWILFLLKLPYLLFELLAVFLLYKAISHDDSKYKALNFLIFNPISLFVIYVFGSHDIIPVFFVILSLYLVKIRCKYLPVVSLVIAIILKLYILFLFPIFILILGKNWRERIKLVLFGFFPLVFLLFISLLANKTVNPKTVFLSVAQLRYIDFLLSFALMFLHMYDRLYPFIIGYCLILFSAAYSGRAAGLFNTLIKYVTVSGLIFYSFCFFHPQYFLLIVPLTAFQISRDRRFLPLFFVLVFCYFIYVFQWGKDTTSRLFMPLNPEFFVNLKSPLEFISHFYPADKFIGIFRSIFTATSLWMAYLLLKTGDSKELA